MPELSEVIQALRELRAAEQAEQAAYEAKRVAEQRLAEVVGVKRRDKDTGFDAEFEAQRLIVDAALAGEPRP